jgi:DNA uptake protein ComE-like DNA-binding protein
MVEAPRRIERRPIAARGVDRREGSSETGTTSAAIEGSSTARMVDINSASEQELLSLPDVGRDRAKAIIDGRPYKNIDELLTRGIVPKNEYDEINDRITAR